MTRETAKKNLEIIKAFAEGKDIQMLEIDGKTWSDIKEPYFTENRDYRIKPVKLDIEYVPWTVENCPLKCGDTLVLKNNPKRTLMVTGSVFSDYMLKNIALNGCWTSFEEIFDNFVMADGTPCGTEVIS